MKKFLMITGATGGLGRAFVLESARLGYDLFLTDQAAGGDVVAARLAEKFNINVQYRPCDLGSEERRGEFINSLKSDGLSFWGLINVAGLDHEGAFLEKNRSQILKILQVNILATMDITHGVLPLRDPDQRFMLINVCSLAGFYPMPYKATYAASKRFLLDFSRALREEIKPFGTVTALCPAGMPTTDECMRSIFSQGFWGLATTMDPQVVAKRTLRAAKKGRAVVIPGALNQFIQWISGFLPVSTKVRYVAKRWSKARAKSDEWSMMTNTCVPHSSSIPGSN
jgi:uncharacterized protein